jgi:hypothetical protein
MSKTVDFSRGTKPKLDEIFNNEFAIVYRKIQNAGSNKIQMSGSAENESVILEDQSF